MKDFLYANTILKHISYFIQSTQSTCDLLLTFSAYIHTYTEHRGVNGSSDKAVKF